MDRSTATRKETARTAPRFLRERVARALFANTNPGKNLLEHGTPETRAYHEEAADAALKIIGEARAAAFEAATATASSTADAESRDQLS